MQPFHVKSRSGFSLVELMVATAVATMLMLILAGVSTQVSKLLTVGISQNQNRNNARVALSFMARELKQAAISKQKTVVIGSTSVSALQLVINPAASAGYMFPDAIFWQAPIATTTTSGDIAEVGYFISRQPKTEDGKTIYHSDLCRLFIEPTDANFSIYNPSGNWLTSSVIGQYVPTSTNNYQGLFLENVIGLWVIPYKDNGLRMNTTASPSDTMTTNHAYDSRTNNVPGAPIDQLPSMIQVSMIVVDSSALKKMTNTIPVGAAATADDCMNALKLSSDANAKLCVQGGDVVYFNVALDNH